MLLTQFVNEFETLYGKNELTFNLHQLLHVALNRRGPIWSNSSYAFESFIGTSAKMIHGSKHTGKENLSINYKSPKDCKSHQIKNKSRQFLLLTHV